MPPEPTKIIENIRPAGDAQTLAQIFVPGVSDWAFLNRTKLTRYINSVDDFAIFSRFNWLCLMYAVRLVQLCTRM